MRYRRILSALAAAVVAAPLVAGPVAAAPPSAPDPGTGARLQQLLDAVHEAGMPGLFAQVRDGRRTWNLAAGVADVESNRPVRPWFRHRIGSVTKTFVATTVLQLVGERRVRLDAPVARYLPGVVPGELGRQVTVRMLLNHTSGLGDYDDVLITDEASVEALQFRTVTPRELVRMGLSRPPTNAPGERWSYSNTNYILLGLLIEKVTGHRYADEVTRRILRPLKLRHTSFPGTDPHIRGPHMAAYVPWSDGTLRDFADFNMSWGWAAGEMISTADDLNRFFRALLTGRLLPADLLRQMLTTVPMEPTLPEAGGYGLGVFWLATPCGPMWGHSGGVVGHTTNSFHSRDARRQVTEAENLILYAMPGEVHPIDTARDAFLTAAVCGSQPAARATSAWSELPKSLTSDLAALR